MTGKNIRKKYCSANKEVLKQKARERYAKKKVLSSKKRILDMTIGDDSEQPVDKCRKMNENNPTVHTALFSMADSSASAPNELDDLLPIHEQEFALKNMQKLHKSMNMKILQCSICCEAWPIKASIKNSSKDHTCKRCKVDKKEPKKFSKENCMIPSPVPDELKNLTEFEQMLISRAFPIMQVYTKPGLGYLGYKGHIITLPNNVQHIADILPHCPKDLPIIAFTFEGKSEYSKEFRLRQEKVLFALLWLVKNNPLCKEITIDFNRIKAVPIDGQILIQSVDFKDFDSNDIMPDRGPVDFESALDDIENDKELLSSFLPESLSQPKENDRINRCFSEATSDHQSEISHGSPANVVELGDEPLNEYTTQYLASLSFPTLFPDTLGDPANNGIRREISDNETDAFSQKLKHLIKFVNFIMGNGTIDLQVILDLVIGLTICCIERD